MFKSLFFLLISLLMTSCFVKKEADHLEAPVHKARKGTVHLGMNESQVLNLMGEPEKTEVIESPDGPTNIVWFYQPSDDGKSYMLPLVFRNGTLQGIGPEYLKTIREEKRRREFYKRNRYTNDKEEWPKNEHSLVNPPPHKSDEEELKKNKSKGEHPMPVYEEEKPVEKKPEVVPEVKPEKKPKKKKKYRGKCPENRSKDEQNYLWD